MRKHYHYVTNLLSVTIKSYLVMYAVEHKVQGYKYLRGSRRLEMEEFAVKRVF